MTATSRSVPNGDGPIVGGSQGLSVQPIVSHYPVSIAADERRELDRLARKLLANEPLLSATQAFGPAVNNGLGPWPSLVLEDHSAISLFEHAGDVDYSYRSLLLAGAGDSVAIGVPRSYGFECYCRDVLGLGETEILEVKGGVATKPLTVRCAQDQRLLTRVAECAVNHGGLNVRPYMGTGHVWVLAAKIAALAGVPVRVGAPPPRLTRRVNDKLWFSRRVAELFGPGAKPSSFPVFGVAALTGRVNALAKRHSSVAVKLPDSASSAGNIVLDSDHIRSISIRSLRHELGRLLARIGWRGRYPLLVTAWESPIVSSPSVQLWIPLRGEGDIIVEGIFDQRVVGVERVFSGATPSALSHSLQVRIANQAAQLGCLFQQLNYFGRCSLDAILVGDDETCAELHWVECNGRWGGTSIPMTLLNRLEGDWQRKPFVVTEREDLRGPPCEIAQFLLQMENHLYIADKHPSGLIVISPSRIELGIGYELMVVGDTVEGARAQAEAIVARLGG